MFMRASKRCVLVRIQLVATTLALLFAATRIRGEVIVDGSLGGGQRALSGSPFEIKHTDGFSSGRNLFHSFKQFTLKSSETATFTGPNDYDNILARVTGGASSIDGQIASTIKNANLFLINPAGILFGSNASINVSGSFFATTADYIKLGEDGKFAATTAPADSVLKVSAPSAFGFFGPQASRTPGTIEVKGSLSAAPGKTLGLIGGDVSVQDGSLHAKGGEIHLASAAAGELGLATVGGCTMIEPRVGATLGKIEIGGSKIGYDVDADGAFDAAAAPRRVSIRGGTLVATNNSQVAAVAMQPGDGVQARVTGNALISNSFIYTVVTGDLRGANAIELNAATAQFPGGSAFVETRDGGFGGNVRLDVSGRLEITEGTILTYLTGTTGPGGDIAITAGELQMSQSATIQTSTVAGLKGGDIRLQIAGGLNLTGGAHISIPGSEGEQIDIAARQVSLDGKGTGINSESSGPGSAPAFIHLAVSEQLSITGEASIHAETTSGVGGAKIAIEAGGTLIGGEHSQISARTSSDVETPGGIIQLKINGRLAVIDGGAITSDSDGSVVGSTIDITAGDVTIAGLGAGTFGSATEPRGITAQSFGTTESLGVSGDIHLRVAGALEMRRGGELAVNTRGSGRGGSIDVVADEVRVLEGSRITASTGGTNPGGNIGVTVSNLQVLGEKSTIAAISDLAATGRGGDVNLRASDRVFVGDGGLVTASAFGLGNGGNVFVSANTVQIANAGALTATAKSSNAGSLAVRANSDVLVSGGLISVEAGGGGRGGSINVAADRVRVLDTGVISAGTLGLGAGGNLIVDGREILVSGSGSLIAATSAAAATGPGGDVRLSGGTLTIARGGSVTAEALGAGNGGSIRIKSGETRLMSGGSISVGSAQSDAGDIRLDAGERLTLDASRITAQAARNGGNIRITARDLIFLTDSQITTAAGLNGGNIFIDPTFVILDGSSISANAVLARGGNVRIISEFFLAPPGSSVTATSERGIDGRVQIDALNTDLDSSLVELPSALLDAESLLRELCTVKLEGFSSFIMEGRGGLPPLPGQARPSLQIVP